MGCWDVQDTCVFRWESFFMFSFFFHNGWEQVSPPNRELFVGILPRIIPNNTQRFFFSLFCDIFFAPVSLLWGRKGRDRSSCGFLPPGCVRRFLLFDSRSHVFISPPSDPIWKQLACLLVLTQCSFSHAWLGTECKPELKGSQQCTCLYSLTGTESISLHFFLLQRGQLWHWDTDHWEYRRPEMPPALYSLRKLSAHAAWWNHSPKPGCCSKTLQSLHAVWLLVIMCRHLTLVDGAEKLNYLCYLSLGFHQVSY